MDKKMNRFESKYFNTAAKMDKALIRLLEEKELEYITVNEICKTAGVNRSTFYLHYDSINDLLDESVQFSLNDFWSSLEVDGGIVSAIETAPLEKLVFITPEYLKPYLEYIKEHRILFRTMLKRASVMGLDIVYERLCDHVLKPVLSRFDCPEEIREYMMIFFVSGTIAIVSRWVENDCDKSIDELTDIIIKCVRPNIK